MLKMELDLYLDNIDIIVKAFKIFIGLKIGTFIVGIGAQFASINYIIQSATAAMYGLNVAVRANLIGLLVTGIQIAVSSCSSF